MIPLQYKVASAALAVILTLIYVQSLKTIIYERDRTISNLNSDIATQNTAIELAGKDRELLQKGIDSAKLINNGLEKEAAKWKDELAKRPAALTCDAAFSNIVETAKKIADDWKAP